VLTVAGCSHAGQTAQGRADRQYDAAVIDQEAASPTWGAARVVKRAVDATTDDIADELQDALKEADMSSTEARSSVDMHLEVDIIPVSDVDRSKQFYERLGWRLDQDVAPLEGLRIVQFTPPGSAASVTFGQGLTTAAPGSAEGGLIVSEIVAAHDELAGRGIDVSDIWHGPPFPVEARQPGPDPERTSYGSFCSFTDPDGNTWLVQEVTTRLPGRV
jgi:catechol 2,3-dioxygenase-like lactoylglutathione lyase family enzyme